VDERLRQFRKEEALKFLAFDSEQGAQLYQEVFLAPLAAGDTVQLTLNGLTRGDDYRGRVFIVAETPPDSFEGTYALSGFADWLFVRNELLRCDAPTWTEELAPAKPASVLAIEVRCPIDGHICLDQFGSQTIRLGTNPVRCTLCRRWWSVPQTAFVHLPHHFVRINTPIAWRDLDLLALHGATLTACERELLTPGIAEQELVFPKSTHLGSIQGGGSDHLLLTYHYTLPGPLSCTLCEWVFGETRYLEVSWVQIPAADQQLVVARVSPADRAALEQQGAELSPWPSPKKLRASKHDALRIAGGRDAGEEHPLAVVLPTRTQRMKTEFLGPVGHQAHGEDAPTYDRKTDFRLPGGALWRFTEAVSRSETDGSLSYSARFYPQEEASKA
jgi:hypothetical protein